jgi:hypothetical protein
MWNEVSGPVAICNVANNTARINDARANVALVLPFVMLMLILMIVLVST